MPFMSFKKALYLSNFPNDVALREKKKKKKKRKKNVVVTS